MGHRTVGMNITSKLKTKRTARIGIALLVLGGDGPYHSGSI